MHVARLKALTFDVTNTLLKARSTYGQQYADAALAHGITADPVALDKAYDSLFEVKKCEMPDYGKHNGVTSREWWSDLVKRVFIKAGHSDANPETLSRVFDTLWEHFMNDPKSAYEVLPNVHEGLTSLKSRGLHLGIVSNFDASLTPTLRAHGLSSYFDFTVTSESAGAAKPEPAIFHRALGEFDLGPLSPGDVGHVGDELENDYFAPIKLGMTAFLIDSEGLLSSTVMKKVVDHRHVVKDLKDVNDLVEPTK